MKVWVLLEENSYGGWSPVGVLQTEDAARTWAAPGTDAYWSRDYQEFTLGEPPCDT